MKLNCVVCKKEFSHAQPHTKFCTTECRKNDWGRRWGRTSDKSVSAGTVGAIAEMAVSMDLMQKGYSVFRALSPACHCDLMVTKNLVDTLRIEVRTGYKGDQDKTTFPYHPTDIGRQDIIAVYIRALDLVEYYLPGKILTFL